MRHSELRNGRVSSGYETTPEKAVVAVMTSELGFGGEVESVTSTKIVLRTQVFGAMDVVTIEGTEKEMLSLLFIVIAYLKVRGDKRSYDCAMSGAFKALEEKEGGVFPLVVGFMPILAGHTMVTEAVLNAIFALKGGKYAVKQIMDEYRRTSKKMLGKQKKAKTLFCPEKRNKQQKVQERFLVAYCRIFANPEISLREALTREIAA